MEQNQSIDILSYVKALTRRLWVILIVFITGSVLAAAVAYILPPVYESTARILVESQQIPEDLAQATVRQSVAERLGFIEQRLLTRQNLLGVIDRIGLFAGVPGMTPTEMVDRVRAATGFESITLGEPQRGQGGLVSAFNITYRADNPQLAARVANEFVTMVLEQNLASRSARASETYEFFRQEVDRLAGQLLDLETQMARYKNEHGDALPDSYHFRLSELSTLEQRQFERERRRIQLGEQRRVIEQFMRDGVAPGGAPQTPEQRQLADLRRILVQKRSILAESHPEIVALKANISAIEASLLPDPAAADADPAGEETQANSLAAAQGQAQLELIERELALLIEQQTSDEARAEELRDSLARTPQVEMALNAYQRRYANLQARYDNAVRKLAEAETGQRLEVNRQAERFEVIEQAQVPGSPVSPNRLMIAGGGAVASLGLGLAIALALELLNPAIRTSADLQRRLQLHPVVTVPYIHTRGERRRRAIKWIIRVALVVGTLAALLWAVEEYVMPLQVLWSNLLDKSGIEDFIQMIQARLG
jgi:polysaccharide biosynthesis transport protein